MIDEAVPAWEQLDRERGRLVWLCASITGDADVADDLAQEALLEAWRNREALRSPGAHAAWLSGIARKVSLRWLRRRARRPAELPLLEYDTAARAPVDLEAELERVELVELLDRALALLPAETRDVLMLRYVQQAPLAEIADRRGLSEGAVAMRLQRGREALLNVLRSDLREAAVSYNLVEPDDDQTWRETRIWCIYCGRRRLLGRFRRHAGGVLFNLRCPDWCRGAGISVSYSDGHGLSPILNGVHGFKPALSRVMSWVDEFYRQAAKVRRVAPCIGCGRPAAINLALPASVPPAVEAHGLHLRCDHCAAWPPPHEGLTGFVLCTPEARRFWRRHPRIVALPVREVEAQGHDALALGFRQVDGSAELGVVVDRATFRTLRIHDSNVP